MNSNVINMKCPYFFLHASTTANSKTPSRIPNSTPIAIDINNPKIQNNNKDNNNNNNNRSKARNNNNGLLRREVCLPISVQ